MSQTTKTAESHHDQGAVIPPDIYDPAVSALRFLAVDAINKADLLAQSGVQARVVSLPSFELFSQRPAIERDTVLPPGMPRVAVEAASTFGWAGIADRVVGMTTFGASGRAVDLYPHFGITAGAAADAARAVLNHED